MAPDAASRPAAPTWTLVVPVKLLAQAKSRLTSLDPLLRSRLALAMAADTIAAATAATTVGTAVVVTDDPDVADLAAALGAVALPDSPAAGLNEALAHGAAYSGRHWPDRGRAGLAGDLPAVRPAELDAALAAAWPLGAAFVPDADGTGTTLYAAAPGHEFRPSFGPGSRAAHLATGAVELSTVPGTALTGLRRDVDTLDDLHRAAAIGLGPQTAALLPAVP